MQKKVSPFDVIKHINEKTDLEFEWSEYSPFMINRGLSFIRDTVFFAATTNRYYNLDKDMQYDFLFHGVPKGKRFGKWEKKLVDDESVDLVADFFCINKTHARAYLELLNDEQLDHIKNKTLKGGRK